ncbi:hypothetical protein C8R44DRAFT_882520 [Mycena epipterygia]|nr:hypothetical protein C8R44DRAFT_882520 [Mycena epipterygia]
MAGYPPHSVFPRCRLPLGWIPPLPYSAPLAFARAGLALLPRPPSTRPQHVPPPSRPSAPPLSRLHRASAPSSQRLLFLAATRPPPARQSRPRPARSALLPLHVAPYPYAPLSLLPVVPARCPRPPLPPLPPARLRPCAPATTLTKDLAKLVTIGLYLIRPSSTLYLTPWTIFWLSTPPFTENERSLALVFPASAFHAFVVQNVSRMRYSDLHWTLGRWRNFKGFPCWLRKEKRGLIQVYGSRIGDTYTSLSNMTIDHRPALSASFSPLTHLNYGQSCSYHAHPLLLQPCTVKCVLLHAPSEQRMLALPAVVVRSACPTPCTPHAPDPLLGSGRPLARTHRERCGRCEALVVCYLAQPVPYLLLVSLPAGRSRINASPSLRTRMLQ